MTPSRQSNTRQARRRAKRLKDNLERNPDYKLNHAKDGRVIQLEFPEGPDQGADALIEANDPFLSIAQAAKKVGLSEKVIHALRGRLRARFEPVNREVKEYTTKHFQGMVETRLHMALHYLDDYVMAAASAKDLGIVIGILTEKRQLLRGEPTAIMSIEERLSLNELIPSVLREAKRRGMVIDMIGDEPRVVGGRPMPNVPAEIGGIR